MDLAIQKSITDSLFGATASDAYGVQCGLGTTMTAEDILNGILVLNVTFAPTEPDQFIELTFTSRLQGA